MAGFRTRDGQFSDKLPIRRSVEEKKLLLRRLKEELAGMKPWAAQSLRGALEKRIAELEADLGSGHGR